MSKEHDVLPPYIDQQYGKPKSDEHAIELLQEVFKDLFNFNFVTMSDKEGIEEQYHLLKARELPAFSWIAQAIHITSKKDPQKRNFRYVVGMLRHWMKWGFGHLPNEEEEEIVDYFEEATGIPATPETRQVIKTLMGKYGGIKVTRMIGSLNNNEDKSLIMAKLLSQILYDRYVEPDSSKQEDKIKREE